MNELTGEELSGILFSGAGETTEATEQVVETTQEAIPDLVVNVQNASSTSGLSELVSQYLPALSGFSDVELIIFFLLTLVWIVCVIWVLRDASARSDSTFYQLFSALLVVLLTPIIGIPIYLAFRPLTYKWDRGLRRESLEQDVAICQHCGGLNKTDNKMCVWCGECMFSECKECHNKFSSQYGYCPECGAPNLE